MALTTLPGFTINTTSSFTFGNANVTGNTTSNNLAVTANITSGNANLGNLATANFFSGNGALLTGIGGAGYVSNGTSNVSIPATNGNVTVSVGGTSNVLVISSGNANVTGNANISGFANVTGNLTAGNVTATNLTGTLLTASQPQLTSVGTLSGLTVSGNTVITGNLTVTGNTTFINSNIAAIQDPLFYQGGGPNNTALASNDGYDRGEILNYYTGGAQVQAFMGWKNANADFEFASNVTIATNVVTINQLANIRAGNTIAGNLLTANFATITSNITSGNANLGNALVANFATINNNANITGNLTSGNANLGNLAVANYFTGIHSNGNSNISIPASNGNINFSAVGNANILVITGTGANLTGYANVVGNVTISANLTAGNANLGNLVTANYITVNTNANVTGNLTTGNANLGNLITANYANFSNNITANGSVVAGNVYANTGTIGAQYITGTISTQSQTQITAIGTLGSLTVTGNVSVGNLSSQYGNISGNYILGNGAFLTGLASPVPTTFTVSNITTGSSFFPLFANGTSGSSAFETHAYLGYDASNGIFSANLFTGAFTAAASSQPNITSVGTLTGLNVTGTAQFTSNATVKMGGGGNGYLLSTDGTGNLIWLAQSAVIAGGTGGGGGGGGGGVTYTAASAPPATGVNVGDQWYNTSTNVLYEYLTDGVTYYWVDTQSPTLSAGNVSTGYVGRSYTGDGSTTNFTVSSGTNVFSVLVFLDGLCQMPTTDYTISGSTITFIPAPLAGMSIQIRELPR